LGEAECFTVPVAEAVISSEKEFHQEEVVVCQPEIEVCELPVQTELP
jgi:hypothetical protein